MLAPGRSWLLALALTASACGGTGAATSSAPPALPTTVTALPPPTTSGAPTTTSTPVTTVPPIPATSWTTTTAAALSPLLGLALEPVAAGLQQPTVVVSAPGGKELYVAEREGRVVAFGPGEEPTTFLDLRDSTFSSGIEQGLLGLALHPGYAGNGRLFVYRSVDGGRRRLSEITGEAERVLFELAQPGDEPRHYGGMLEFGPDGYLYVAVGDGAASRNGQDPETLFGTILRLDVDRGEPYAVPADNPFVGGAGAPEVWAYGLRNPWRFAVDPVDGLVYIGDVGLEQREEVDVVPLARGGYNFGWSIAEGDRCFSVSDCDPAGNGLTTPVLTYGHDDGCSITGGFVYRGSAIPELAGHYFYADWCGQWVRSFRYRDGMATDERDWSADLPEAGQVNTFGLGPDGELYLANFAGEVWKVVARR